MEAARRIFFKGVTEDEGEPPIHYIWVGPPSPETRTQTAQGLQMPKHDIDGPLQMSRLNKKNPLVFWCLKEHVARYREVYKGTRITVCCIEDDIEQKLQSENKDTLAMAMALKLIIEKCVKDPNRNAIRDRVTVKDFFSLYLLATIDGPIYTLDTGIFPEGPKNIYFANDEKFMAPYINDHDDYDIWLLFSSSSKSKDIPKAAFLQMFYHWHDLEDKYADKLKTLYKWTETLGQQAIDVINKHSSDGNVKTIFTFQDVKGVTRQSAISVSFAVDKNGTFSDTPQGSELSFCKKIYNNTHKIAKMLPVDGTEAKHPQARTVVFRPVNNPDYYDHKTIFVNKCKEWCVQIKALIEAYHFGTLGHGGKTITVNGTQKNIPKHAHDQWEKINNALKTIEDGNIKQWFEIYSQVVAVGKEAHSTIPKSIFGLGKRAPETQKFYEVFTQAPISLADDDEKFKASLRELLNLNIETKSLGMGGN